MTRDFLQSYTSHQLDALKRHLEKRVKANPATSDLGVVYDITNWCDMKCIGCGVNARKYTRNGTVPITHLESNTAEVITILDKLDNYVSARPGFKFCLNFGGGEPFLRHDFIQIIKEASQRFGKKSVGLDTNGTVITKEQLAQIGQHVSYIGISLDGLEEYHNWWRGKNRTRRLNNAFEKTVETIKAALAIPEVSKIIEVSTVATKKNLEQIPPLMSYIRKLGVTRYSVHRAMPIGRMSKHMALIPSPEEYLQILVALSEAEEQLEMEAHLHHSIESIYASLLLNYDTYVEKKLGAPDKRASIGVDPRGNVFFDPWFMVPPWNRLSEGSLLKKTTTLETIFEQASLSISQEYSRPETRCHGCEQRCSGGSRVVAAASHISENSYLKNSDVTVSHILSAMREKDPACPLTI